MWITIIIWFLIGITTALFATIQLKNDSGGISLSNLFMLILWVLMGPVLWLSFGLMKLIEYIDKHKEDSIIKFK